jgi:PAS domain S-box-containing protein
MEDQSKTKQVLIQELVSLRQRIAGIEQSESDRKRVEETLRESENKYRLLADNVKDVIFVLDMNLNYTYVSPSVKILRGYEPEEVLKQQSIEQTLTPSSMDLAMKALSEIMELEKLEHKEDNISRTLPLEIRRKDGSTVWTETKVSFIRDKDQQPVGILGITRDITERKQAADALLESEERYRLITENTAHAIALFDLNLKPTAYVTPSILKLRGYTVEEAMTQTLNQTLTPDSLELVSKIFAEQMALESSGTADPARTALMELEEYCKDGSTIWVEIAASFLRDNNFKPTGILTVTRDITERKQAEEALRESEEKFRMLSDQSLLAIGLIQKGLFKYVNQAFCDISGYTSAEIMTWQPYDFVKIVVHPDDEALVMAPVDKEQTYAADVARRFEFRGLTKNGKTLWLNLYLKAVLYQGRYADLLSFVDITERKQAEEALKKSEKKYRLLADNVKDVIFVLDMNLNYTYVSPSIKILRGYEPEEVLKQSYIDILTPSSMHLAMKTLSDVMELEKIKHQEITESRTLQLEMKRKDGSTVWTEVKFSFIRDENQRPVGIMGLTRDITERKKAEERLRFEEQRFRAFVDHSLDIIVILNLEGIVTYINPAIERVLGYKVEERIGANTLEVINPDDLQYLADNVIILFTDTNAPVVQFEVRLRHKDGSWHTFEAVGSNMVNNNVVEAVIVNYRDITERKKAEEKIQQTLESLKKAVGTTIQVLVSAVEARDPYTAGHQIRSADLARAIATDMGLCQDKIEGIRIAGSIHDIGKLSIPAEILSKPTKLTEIEFSLVKGHSQSGYEMLKDVESPWPLAQIVYQHHERMNGSGYPRNLKGDEIILEARIMAVADVVETMASHRPYRAALGIEAAMEEVEKNKGILYDNTVADACLKLFREKGYQLK